MKDTMNTSDNIIRRAIDGVAPAEGAKERMKKNIYEKAQKAQKQEKTSVSSVRFWKIAMPVAACLCIAVIGAVKLIPTMGQNDPGKITISDNSEDNMQIASPFEEVSSAKVFEDRLGIQADAPKGAKNVAYNILSKKIRRCIQHAVEDHSDRRQRHLFADMAEERRILHAGQYRRQQRKRNDVGFGCSISNIWCFQYVKYFFRYVKFIEKTLAK